MIKFPTNYKVRELHGNQVAAREHYIVMMEMDDHLQAMNIEEHRAVTKPVEKLEEIVLNDSKPDQMTKIGTLTSLTIRQALMTFLKDNRDVFAWSYEDMLGIDLLIMVHKLNVSPSFPPICQKKRVFAPE